MRLLILTYEFPENVGSMGGVGRVTYDVAKQFSGKRNNIDIAVITPKGTNYIDFDRKQPFKIIRITNKLFFKEAIMLLQAIKHLFKYNVNTIFCSTWLPSGLIAYLVSSIFRIPYIVMAHGSEILDNQNSGNLLKEKLRQVLRFFKRHVYNNSKYTFSISRFTKELLVKEGVYPEKIVIINNGVNVKKFKPVDVSSEFRRKYSIEKKKGFTHSVKAG